MGKKRRKNGKHLFLHGACLLAVLLLSAGCATISDFQRKYQEDKHLQLADNLATKGDYEGALKAYGDIVRLFPGDPPGDSALFYMGLIWAYPANPERDYEKALKYFQQLPRDFPRSPLKRQASLWVSAINELIRYEDRVQELEKMVKSLNKRLNTLKEIDIGIEEKKREDRSRE